MSLEYILTTGVYVAGFLALSLKLVEAINGSLTIKSILFALPVG